MMIGSVRYEGAPGELLFPTTGLVLQDPYVQISGVRDTVLAEIRFTLENLQNVPPNADQRIRALLGQLGIEHLANRKPTSLSGGETQRVALATMLIAHPPVLLLDEPTTALDYGAQDKLRRIIRSLKGSVTVIVTDTHLDFGLAAADDIAIVDHGRNIIQGPPPVILSRLGELTALVPHRGWGMIHALSTSPKAAVRHRAQLTKVLDLR
jgi:energy-coupling factor transport system ATP-binding protein